jgi:hypothetical protein
MKDVVHETALSHVKLDGVDYLMQWSVVRLRDLGAHNRESKKT